MSLEEVAAAEKPKESLSKNVETKMDWKDCNDKKDLSSTLSHLSFSSCWVCARPHHTVCVGLDKEGDRFICGACQVRHLAPIPTQG